MLARRPLASAYCYGDAPGWADLHLVPALRNARRFGVPVDPYVRLLGVEAACRELPAFQSARPEAQPDFQA